MKDENIQELKEYIENYKHKKRGSSGYYKTICDDILNKIKELEAQELMLKKQELLYQSNLDCEWNNFTKQCEELSKEIKQSENVTCNIVQVSFDRIKKLRNIFKRIL